MNVQRRIFFLFAFFALAISVNEPQTDNIAVEPLSQTCLARQTNKQAGQTCRDWQGIPLGGPSPFPCACLNNDKAGGAFPGTGKVEIANPIKEDFVDYTIGVNPPATYSSLTAFAFTDNTNEIYVLAKAGIVFRIDTNTEAITTLFDFRDQVHDVGDYGGLSIEVHTNFAQNPFVYVSYVNGSIYGPNTEVNTVSFVRVIRIVTSGGKFVSRSFILGQNYLDSNPLCSSSHAGGALAMGHDGSLFITLGEGSHFDTDIFDFGQYQARYPYSAVCPSIFPGQMMGALKAQSKDSLGGKLVRVDPATGNGICNDNQGFNTRNPYCTGNMDLRSPRARIWAMGFRNPFSMNVRPAGDNEPAGPGVPYVGDVGLGSYEEVNAVTGPGQNFGWPCWEGPQPMAGYRDSSLNNLNNKNITRPIADDGSPINCPYVYANIVTQHPTYYWSRYTHDMDGLYGEQYVLGTGFTGNCVSGVTFYTGDNYPASFKNQVFFSDYGTQWVKSMTVNGDKKVDQYEFLPLSVPVVDLEINAQNGDVCYMELLEGVIHCLSYQGGLRAPTIAIKSNVTAGAAPLYVGFSSDNSEDRLSVQIAYTAWDFGDNSGVVVDPNPSHVYAQNGVYKVTCWINNGDFTVNATLTVTVGNAAPVAVITAPAAGDSTSFTYSGYDASKGDTPITFSGNAVGGQGPFTYFWDIYMVHTNHYHPQSYTAVGQVVTATLSQMGANSHIGERINFLAILTVTDVNGLSSKSYTRLRGDGWYSNAPVASFVANADHYTAGQFIEFDASKTYDVDLDTITYIWDFGDGRVVPFDPNTNNRFITHAYSKPGTYTVTLTAVDNWNAQGKTTRQVTIAAGYVQNPPTLRFVDGKLTTSTEIKSTQPDATSSTSGTGNPTTSGATGATESPATSSNAGSTTNTPINTVVRDQGSSSMVTMSITLLLAALALCMSM